jgi:hypothetical protein
MQGLANTLNEPAQQLYRKVLRDSIFRLLNEVDFPGKEAQAGRTWVQQPGRSIHDLERLKERCLERLKEVRGDSRIKSA